MAARFAAPAPAPLAGDDAAQRHGAGVSSIANLDADGGLFGSTVGETSRIRPVAVTRGSEINSDKRHCLAAA